MSTENIIIEDPCIVLNDSEYDFPLHIAAIFIIMGFSLTGTILPILGKRFSILRIREVPFYCAKMFGSGVILATALIHMFTPASEYLTNECLPETFTEDYGAWPAAICMISIVVIHFIQFMAAKEVRKLQQQQQQQSQNQEKKKLDIDEPTTSKLSDPENGTFQLNMHSHEEDHIEANAFIALKEKQISTYILELGIASHSIIIGLTLGVARDEFTTLLVALTFHQFFEGIALSTVVLDSQFKNRRLQTVVMIIFYSLTTPIGVAIGIGISESFNENAVEGLIIQGVLDSVAAGILLYDALVNIIVPHFKSPKFVKDPVWFQSLQFVFFWIGAAIMALIGKWA